MSSSGYAPLSTGDNGHPPPTPLPWTTILLSLGILISVAFLAPSAYSLSVGFSFSQTVVCVLCLAALFLSCGGLYTWLRGENPHHRDLVASYHSHVFNCLLGLIVLFNALLNPGSFSGITQLVLGSVMVVLGILGGYYVFRSRGGAPVNWGVPAASSGMGRGFSSMAPPEPKGYRLDGGMA
ncbi:hypothetical protein HDU93_003554 [Gonapodya sp. JEL0774]|nr:hypothetical protein HDU93_003554 [Gonapodya sp. JEL0774]